ncbi:MAG: HAMP domain-containing histidine kinase [Flavobacteriales bacterium]|nr:HAMP domain-containing histidine kinase [Flavobacteriales bacterium]
MNIYSKKQRWKLLLAGTAIIIIVASLWYTNILVKKIETEERKKVELWADAIQNKASLVSYTGELFQKISAEERNKIELWAEANKRIATSNNHSDLTFYLDILSRNTTIPVIVIDENENIVNSRNFDLEEGIDTAQFLVGQLELMKVSDNDPIDLVYHIPGYTFKQKLYYKDSKIFSELKVVLDDLIQTFISEIVINSASVPVIYTDSTQTTIIEYGNLEGGTTGIGQDFLEATIADMRLQNDPIAVTINNEAVKYIFYSDSELLKQLKYYPYLQILIIGLFLLISYYLFSTSRKVEQNQVWVGMAKETAHQLGTPLSSLMAWVEYLKLKDVVDENTINELSKDITRLEIITERFSKIGSVPKLESENLNTVINDSLNYLKVRISKKVNITFTTQNNAEIYAKLNPSLFSWVLENLIKNAVDAMKGDGNIDIYITDQSQYVYIDITDTGAGIPRANQKTIFEPGFTTKQRGWGLGLSLVKRIIENYHEGKIFVKQSDATGTTFRIVLNK